MSLKQSLFGYVLIHATGPNVGRFLNLCVKNQIRLWNIRALGEDQYRFFVSGKAVWKMRPYLHKTRTRVHIRKKHGLPFLAFRYRKRILFPIALVLVSLLFGYASRFVWKIEIFGNSYLTEDVLITYLEQKHAAFGASIREIDCDGLELSLRQDFAEVIWASVSVEGTDLIIELQEKVSSEGETPEAPHGSDEESPQAVLGSESDADGQSVWGSTSDVEGREFRRSESDAGGQSVWGSASDVEGREFRRSESDAGGQSVWGSTSDMEGQEFRRSKSDADGQAVWRSTSDADSQETLKGNLKNPVGTAPQEAATPEAGKDADGAGRSLVAVYDAVIDSIITRSGTPKVQAKDVVKKGDILVEGSCEIKDDAGEVAQTLEKTADADVIGQVAFPYSDSVPAEEIIRRTKRKNLLSMTFDCLGRSFTLPLGIDGYQDSDIIREYHQLHLTHQFYLPLGIAITHACEIEENSRLRTDEEALGEAENRLEHFKERLNESGIEVIAQQITMKKVGDHYQVEGTVTGLTNIGTLSPE